MCQRQENLALRSALAHTACGRTNARLVAVAEFNVDGKRQQVEACFGRGGLQAHYACLPHPIQSAAAHWERVSPSYRRIEARCEASGAWAQSRIACLPHPIQSAAAHWERVSPQFRRIEARCEASGPWAQSRIACLFGLRLGAFDLCRVRVHASGFGGDLGRDRTRIGRQLKAPPLLWARHGR
jgi:hypothetical protein